MLSKPVEKSQKKKETSETPDPTQADKFKKSFFSDIIIS